MICTALFTWWLSGYDDKVTGQNLRADAVRRGVRCGITLVAIVAAIALTLRDRKDSKFINPA